MQQEANITIDNDHITVERIQIACGREIRVVPYPCGQIPGC